MKLRLPLGLKAAIDDAARRAGRTLNAEIVHRLESTFVTEASVVGQAGALTAELAASTETLKGLVEALIRNTEARDGG